MNELMADPLLTIAAVRQSLGCGYAQLNRWITQGKLPVVRLGGPHGHRKVRLSALRAFLAAGESQGGQL
jgi:excisionase family DNA binding protein